MVLFLDGSLLPIVAGAMQEYDRPTQLGLKLDMFQSNKDATVLPCEVGVCHFPTPQPGPAFHICFCRCRHLSTNHHCKTFGQVMKEKSLSHHQLPHGKGPARKEYYLGKYHLISTWRHLSNPVLFQLFGVCQSVGRVTEGSTACIELLKIQLIESN